MLLWMPWFSIFLEAASVRTESFYVLRADSWWWPTWAVFARIPFNWIVFLAGKRVVAYAIPLYFTSAAFMISAALSQTPQAVRGLLARAGVPASLWQSDPNPDPSGAGSCHGLFLWNWAVLPPLVVWLTDVLEGHRVVEIARYVVATAPAVYMLAGAGLAAMMCWRKLALTVLIAHAALALINNAYAHAVPQREPWRRMAEIVESECKADDILLVSQHYDVVCLDRYLTRPRIQYGVSPPLGAAHIARLVSGQSRFWLLTSQDGEEIKSMMPPEFKICKQIDLHHGLHLRLYQTKLEP